VVDEKMTGKIDLQSQSSTLYDTVAVHLAFSEVYLGMQDLGVRVTDSGRTLIDNKAKQVRCAMLWQDKTAFEDYVTRRLLAGPVKI
jgi:ribose 5-phosphate isomerase RpiB